MVKDASQASQPCLRGLRTKHLTSLSCLRAQLTAGNDIGIRYCQTHHFLSRIRMSLDVVQHLALMSEHFRDRKWGV